jgi:sucrose phosphorylase
MNKTLKNQVQLITYPDSLGENLAELHYVLRRYLSDAIGGVHILPFYPSSGDRGFAPTTYDTVDPIFGSWQDIERIGKDYDLIIDFMVNHISRQSEYFRDYVENGKESRYADMFLSFDKFSADGEIPEDELAKVYTRKPRPPYIMLDRKDGSREKIWCTFDTDQIDLDMTSPVTHRVMRHQLINLARTNCRMIRMDAVAYAVKKIGTSCFFVEPEIWEILEWLREYTRPFDTEILPELHEHYSYQLKLAEHGYWCYDFALPMLVLNALYHHTSEELEDWLRICPRKQITTLDTHDGIGIVDVMGLLTQEEIDQTIEGLYKKGSNVKRLYSGAEYDNLDIYQVNCTYYSALEGNDDAYMAARTIQFFTPGIPQVYYVGLLAGENDIELVERMRNGRFINRHNFPLAEVKECFEKPVVQRLLRLMRFRSSHPAFNGELSIPDTADDQIELVWTHQDARATASIDLRTYETRVSYSYGGPDPIQEFTV